MRYQRTQIYLDPGEHAALVREAAARGVSLAELMRQVVSAHVSERAPRYAAKTFGPIVGIGGADEEPSDVARHEDRDKGEAFDYLYEKSRARAARAEEKTPRRR